MQKSLDEFEFPPDSTTDYRVSCPLMSKNQCLHFFSDTVDLILFKVADNEEMHNILDVFNFPSDWMTDNRFSCPYASKNTSIDSPYNEEIVSPLFLACLLTSLEYYSK